MSCVCLLVASHMKLFELIESVSIMTSKSLLTGVETRSEQNVQLCVKGKPTDRKTNYTTNLGTRQS